MVESVKIIRVIGVASRGLLGWGRQNALAIRGYCSIRRCDGSRRPFPRVAPAPQCAAG